MTPFHAARTLTQDIKALLRELTDVLSRPQGDRLRDDGDLSMPMVMAMLDYPQADLEAIESDVTAYLSAALAQVESINADEGESFWEDPAHDRSPFMLRISISAALPNVEGARSVLRRLRSLIKVKVQRMRSLTAAAQAAAAQALSWIGSIMGWLKSLSAQLWSMLANLLTPTQWKMSGKVGTGVLGLIDVGVEITFGDGQRPGAAKT
ncbi:hypothetical protein GIW81_06150 [Hyphomicrobium sp. xq]|uniref:Uncharacterized protein n=1 Tax=Hyphomicrobium album TaxID=2665159 RepID=A0A6I3KIN3_9HYPH|nr:hypothetical protein [Hyphomicrobium album]MTD93916.1 hypothetical protein [Hyphomicrobium album]